jgi:hypothetical protein
MLKWSEHAGGGALVDAKYPLFRKGHSSIELSDRVPLTSRTYIKLSTTRGTLLTRMGTSRTKYASRKEVVSQGEVRLVCRLSRQEYHAIVMTQTSI